MWRDYIFFINIRICLGACGRGGSLFEKSSAKTFLWEKFLWVDIDGANKGAFILVGWRAQYLPLAKTVFRGAFLYAAHFSLGGIKLWLLGGL